MRINKFVAALSVAGTLLSIAAPVQAASSYKIVKKKQVKTYPHSRISYSYQLPILSGSSAATKKINASLNSAYQKDLKSFKKNGYSMAKDVSNWYYTKSDLYIKQMAYQMGEYTITHVYSGAKYISFGYHKVDAAYQAAHEWAEAATYSKKTGKKLSLSNLVKGNNKTITRKIIKAQDRDTRSFLQYTNLKPSKLQFIVKGKKIYITNNSATYSFGGYRFLKPIKVEK